MKAIKDNGRILDQNGYNTLPSQAEKDKFHRFGAEYHETEDILPPPVPPKQSNGLAVGALATALGALLLAFVALFFPTTDDFVRKDEIAGMVKGEVGKLKPAKMGIGDIDGLQSALDGKAEKSASTDGKSGDKTSDGKVCPPTVSVVQNVNSGNAVNTPAPRPVTPAPRPAAPVATPAPQPAPTAPAAPAASGAKPVVCAWINPDTKVRYDRPAGELGQCIDWVNKVSAGFTNTRKIADQ